MTTFLDIERAIRELPPEEYGQFRRWLEDYELEQELVASSAQVAQVLDGEDGGEHQLVEE